MSVQVREKLQKVLEEIKPFQEKRPVALVLATKTVSLAMIQEAMLVKELVCGENRAQELCEKWDPKITWHFIGQLQSNKVASIIDKVDLIHSVDRLSLAEEINRSANKINKQQKILLEVNTSNEESKGGIQPEKLLDLVVQIQEGCPHIEICGLMTLAIFDEDQEKVRACFRLLRELRGKLQAAGHGHITELSMGMSSDYQLALEEGATIIRLGSAIFGQR